MSIAGQFDYIFNVFASQIYQNHSNFQQDVLKFVSNYLNYSEQIVKNIANIIQKAQIDEKKIIWYYILDICIKNYTNYFRKYIKQQSDIFVEDMVNSIDKKQLDFFRGLVKVILSWDGGLISQNFLNKIFKEFQNRKKQIDILDFLTKEDVWATEQHYNNNGVEGKMLSILKKISKIKKEQNFNQQSDNQIQEKKKKILNQDINQKKLKKTSIKQSEIFNNKNNLPQKLYDSFFCFEKNQQKLKYLTQSEFDILLNQQINDDNLMPLKRLYNNSYYICANCGISFECKEKLDFHLDKHYQQNFKLNQSLNLKKKQFISKNEFYNQNKFIALKDDEKQKKQKESNIVKFEDTKNLSQSLCKICGFKIQIFFNSSLKSWYFKNAVTVEKNNNEFIVHQKCFQKIKSQEEDLEKEFEAEDI